MQDQANEVQSKVDAITARVKAASGSRDSSRDLNAKLNSRLGVATATLLQLERQSQSNGRAVHTHTDAATSRSHTMPSPAGSQCQSGAARSPHSCAPVASFQKELMKASAGHVLGQENGGNAFSTKENAAIRMHKAVAAYHGLSTDEAPEPVVAVTEQKQFTSFDPLIPIRPTQLRPMHTFVRQSELCADEALSELVQIELASDNCSASIAHYSKVLRKQDVDATQDYVRQFASSIDGYLAASCAPAGTNKVCWYLQTPFCIARGSRLSFSTSLSNPSCCPSMFMTLLGIMLESTCIDKLVQQRSGHVNSKGAAAGFLLNEAAVKHTYPFDSGYERMGVMQMLDGIVGCASAPPAGMLGMHPRPL